MPDLQINLLDYRIKLKYLSVQPIKPTALISTNTEVMLRFQVSNADLESNITKTFNAIDAINTSDIEYCHLISAKKNNVIN